MQGDAFANYIEEHPKGSIVEGVISQIDDKSITVSLTEEVLGVIRANEATSERVDDLNNFSKKAIKSKQK